MSGIVFMDTEVSMDHGKIFDLGAINEKGDKVHTGRVDLFMEFIKETSFLCGHNIIKHDLKFLARHDKSVMAIPAIDTLSLSPLLFPKKPYHKLVKDDKLHSDQLNNPLNDAIQAKNLFFDECTAFEKLEESMKQIYRSLLQDQEMFKGFFKYVDTPKRTLRGLFNTQKPISKLTAIELNALIRKQFKDIFCDHAPIENFIEKNPIELAYCLAVLYADDDASVTPKWVLRTYPDVENVMTALRNAPCLEGCSYCNQNFDPVKGLQDYFGYPSYRTFDGENLQEKAVSAALNQKSLLAIFPTGGGKSITFQIPALMAGRMTKGLTVIISPLQSLMKDQVDNLEAKGITDAVTINGLLDPIERAKAFERVENGSAKLLYISPESLRSRSIEHLLLGRRIERFVIDEAHCFSAWGQDFRVDYLYIADFIKKLVEMKSLQNMIPVSCFTATAKQNVVADIRAYFKDNLSLELDLYSASAARKNLTYKVIRCNTEDKYDRLRNLITEKQCPTIVYVSSTRLAYELADRLTKDGYLAKSYHGKMEKKEKSANQDSFTRGETDVMVATSAFGMGVDKSDVGLVIHYQISNSLENYVQEAGRAGRDEHIEAECFVLFNDDDLNAHFTLLNQTKLGISEISQVWKAIKEITRNRNKVSQSALEIARKAGWDDSIMDLETRVRTAISALEQAGYIKRGQNMPSVYADSILAQSMADASNRISKSSRFNDKDEELARRIIGKLISARSRKHQSDEGAESRVDYISDQLGIEKEEVIRIIGLLREERLLSDSKDLTAYMNDDLSKTKAINNFKSSKDLEAFLLEQTVEDGPYNIKTLNELAEENDLKKVTTHQIINILNYWAINHDVEREFGRNSKNHFRIRHISDLEKMRKDYNKRMLIAEFILQFLYDKYEADPDEGIVEFSVLELKEAYEFENRLIGDKISLKDVENGLFYLSRIDALKIEGGFMVLYNRLQIERLEMDNRIKYKNEDYKSLKAYYEQKVHQIHIVGEYAKKMIENYEAALAFVDDYFTLNYQTFLKKYFKGSKGEEINLNITPAKFRQLFGELSPTQLSIVNDRESQYIVVAAGPGSGKTRILVHKLAALLLMEDVKHEQLLMVTFSRAAATEFKRRLIGLIGGSAHYVEIKTFHSYCFDLLGRVGDVEKSRDIVRTTAKMIYDGEVEPSRITKTVMVIDEAQDMDENEFEFIRAMAKQNNDIRIIAVGDDDQNIYEFRGSSSKYMTRILKNKNSKFYELVENYRSKPNLVELTNRYATTIPERMKSTPIIPRKQGKGRIEWVYHQSDTMIDGVLDKLKDEGAKGSICMMTFKNEDALQMTGRLIDAGYPAKLIQNREEIRLENLDEVRFFIDQLKIEEGIHTIDEDTWNEAKQSLFKEYGRSEQIAVMNRMLDDFTMTAGKHRYVSDFMIYIKESKFEDFLDPDVNTIQVSTMHKSKGQEFDTVILLLDKFSDYKTEAKRIFYVAMTRAKENLQIHFNDVKLLKGFGFDSNSYSQDEIEGMSFLEMPWREKQKSLLLLQLGYKDIFLSYFYEQKVQDAISKLRSGDILRVSPYGCFNKENVQVIVFSKSFKESLSAYMEKGYTLGEAKISAVVYWRQEDQEREVRILFPVIKLIAD
ncbi:RecQ family ATP-dependent DNA helicase [Fusibacter tunisiensis]|uniref:DNA 3'-5' helicase n=1 Tax=Fusibacter tunisiensis TaxID=1008308 RepID=A0ABS2MTZ9_9FIRM|nr:RecQ family ATP-dependent DNA helicase [Fusibacter tunisiensis]MBM7562882.1 ATP-dependent DNA helicase RecQ [Fusibacter tunisiensis]